MVAVSLLDDAAQAQVVNNNAYSPPMPALAGSGATDGISEASGVKLGNPSLAERGPPDARRRDLSCRKHLSGREPRRLRRQPDDGVRACWRIVSATAAPWPPAPPGSSNLGFAPGVERLDLHVATTKCPQWLRPCAETPMLQHAADGHVPVPQQRSGPSSA
jgi:hypothetical protein